MRFCEKGSGGSVRFNMMNKPGASTLNDSVEGGGISVEQSPKKVQKKPRGVKPELLMVRLLKKVKKCEIKRAF